jgi:hypothetical protein
MYSYNPNRITRVVKQQTFVSETPEQIRKQSVPKGRERRGSQELAPSHEFDDLAFGASINDFKEEMQAKPKKKPKKKKVKADMSNI